MTYKLESFGFPTAAFTDGPLIHTMELDTLYELRDEVYHAFFSQSVDHVKITRDGKRRMVINCAQFDADYMR